jgi:uncharacterized protein involved in type VI secretion and phage assembly
MKDSIKVLKWFMLSSALALSLMTGATASAQSQTNKLRIGVYDSRAVAAAYANSTEFQQTLKAVRADYEQAKAAGDDKRVNQLESRMKLQQRQLHEQVFSTASVAGILAKIRGALPAVAKKARVQAIVSKWELSHQEPDVELVDVTEDLAVLFHTSDNEQKWRGILKHPPVPIEEIAE